MPKKGRRLKRYLGLVRAKQPHVCGCIDHISPTFISGWATSEEGILEVKLMLGNNILASTKLDVYREDVNKAKKISGSNGFKFILNFELPRLNWKENLQVLAINTKYEYESLNYINNKRNTEEIIKQILNSDYRGVEGHIDGIKEDGLIHGWAYNKDQLESTKIWMHYNNVDNPYPIICSEIRNISLLSDKPLQCGFTIDPCSLPYDWNGKEIWCCYDKTGIYKIPQIESIKIPELSKVYNKIDILKEEINDISNFSYLNEIGDINDEEIKNKWKELEEFRELLDVVEEQLNNKIAKSKIELIKELLFKR